MRKTDVVLQGGKTISFNTS